MLNEISFLTSAFYLKTSDPISDVKSPHGKKPYCCRFGYCPLRLTLLTCAIDTCSFCLLDFPNTGTLFLLLISFLVLTILRAQSAVKA